MPVRLFSLLLVSVLSCNLVAGEVAPRQRDVVFDMLGTGLWILVPLLLDITIPAFAWLLLTGRPWR